MSETSAHCSSVGTISGALRRPEGAGVAAHHGEGEGVEGAHLDLLRLGHPAVTRARISSAARREKVRARMRSGLTSPSADQVRDPLHEHARLARARSGEHEERSSRMLDGPELVGVEVYLQSWCLQITH